MDIWLWSQKEDVGPSQRREHAMIYDSNNKRVLLFGGTTGPFNNLQPSGDTWQWDGAGWEQVADTGPSPRFGHTMAYDSARQKTVLFGGTGSLLSASIWFKDTWEWDGSEWTQVADTGPLARQNHAMVYDSARQKTVLFGGFTAQGPMSFNDTWEWDGSEWTQVADTGPSKRYTHVMAYNSAKQNILLFGGYDGDNSLGDTWELNKNMWKQLQNTGPLTAYGAMTDSQKGIILFGGSQGGTSTSPENSNTWRWTGKFWVQVQDMGPSARQRHSMAYDSERDRIVLFGGLILTGLHYGDTWELEVKSSQ